ncbi:gram-negative pili assembly chaperone, C-terminal domain protein [Escherichia coli 1-176-05_S3_C2]|uniref:fimbrial biogenesis chaperone n=1 Tax=Escherichia TaxID=561 RepID=UPI00044753D0|nr:gram-negative pili assembly chaperone, C-terminal domain protein [Escherichia coli 1-176-05_S3_C2]WGM53377.1 fimbria/pilus periplasmic chaperone [Escherichia ruysiae]HAL9679167.1 fimbria/pilus periplasmic chaperone [Escherichia coli]HAV7815911.1 fimbria/pilus periplasmic chaperone [Escherichia coli]HAW5069548.1 fimbria/pilus periplasmic chaperone [Escherichia coli]
MKLSTYFLATALLLSNSVAQAGVIVGGTRVIYNGDKKETSLHLKNPDKSSYLIQSWVDGDPQTNAKAPFIITPPLFRLGATKENALRIIRAGGNLPTDRETMYWMNIKTIPATEKQENVNTLQIAIKTRIKLIYRPHEISSTLPEQVVKNLTWRRSGQQITVTNPTAYYMNFSQVKIGGKALPDATYVAPMSSATFQIPANTTGNVSWTIISDYGAAGDVHNASL